MNRNSQNLSAAAPPTPAPAAAVPPTSNIVRVKSEEDDSKFPYELSITIKKGTVRGGGFANSAHVITSIDGVEIHKTEDSPSPPQWNQTIIKKLDEIQRVDPIVIGFSVYKKRWTSAGYKLVGSTQFPLSELVPLLNKEAIDKDISLNTNRLNLTLSGTLSVSLQLREVAVSNDDSGENEEVEEPFTWSGFFDKWKSILTTSKRPVNAVVVNAIHDSGSFFKFLLKYENPFFESTMKLLLVFFVTIIMLLLFYESSVMSNNVNNIDNIFQSMTNKLSQVVHHSS